MKLVLAYVQPFKVEEVSLHLGRLPGFPGMSVTAVRGYGHKRAGLAPSAIEKELDEFTGKALLQIVAEDDQVDSMCAEIIKAARTGGAGDGLVFVVPVERAQRIAGSPEGPHA